MNKEKYENEKRLKEGKMEKKTEEGIMNKKE